MKEGSFPPTPAVPQGGTEDPKPPKGCWCPGATPVCAMTLKALLLSQLCSSSLNTSANFKGGSILWKQDWIVLEAKLCSLIASILILFAILYYTE